MIAALDARVAQLGSPDVRRDRSRLQKTRKRLVAGRPLLDQDDPIVESLGLGDTSAARMQAQHDLDAASDAFDAHVQASFDAEIDRMVQTVRQGSGVAQSTPFKVRSSLEFLPDIVLRRSSDGSFWS